LSYIHLHFPPLAFTKTSKKSWNSQPGSPSNSFC